MKIKKQSNLMMELKENAFLIRVFGLGIFLLGLYGLVRTAVYSEWSGEIVFALLVCLILGPLLFGSKSTVVLMDKSAGRINIRRKSIFKSHTEQLDIANLEAVKIKETKDVMKTTDDDGHSYSETTYEYSIFLVSKDESEFPLNHVLSTSRRPMNPSGKAVSKDITTGERIADFLGIPCQKVPYTN